MVEPNETLTLTDTVAQAMVNHALAGLPNEACGLFSGAPGGTAVDTFHPMINAAASPTIYRLDDQEYVTVERSVDQAGQTLLGVMHSHTHTDAYPSSTDVDAATPLLASWFFLIVTLKDPAPALRAFRIVDENITEVQVTAQPG
ncbi:MAG: M67 family metallopeptidase [Actinomycetota bacterium]|nr:M67 family metallopeptidase [Actinomycetota bacterium]